MKSTIAIINSYPKFDAVFEPIADGMRMAVKKYSGIRTMADDLNAKILPMEELALIIVTGTSEENDPDQFRRNISLLGQLAKHSKLKSVPVLFLGYKGCAELQQSCESNCAEYLELPVRKSEFTARIREICGETGSEHPEPPITIGRQAPGMGSEPVKYGQSAPSVQDYPGTMGSEPSPVAITIARKPPKAGSEHVKNRTDQAAESERRLATMMFADISGFTAMSEKMDPEEVTGVMNGCFEMLGRASMSGTAATSTNSSATASWCLRRPESARERAAERRSIPPSPCGAACTGSTGTRILPFRWISISA